MAGNKLGRNSSWRKATVRDIAKATLIRQRIKTTEAKAKEARKLVDQLITLGKKGTLVHKRRAFAILCDHKLVSDLFNKIAVRFASRHGGYTRIIKFATNRKGDNAKMVFLELTEQEKVPLKEKKIKKAPAVKEVEDVKAVSEAGDAKEKSTAVKKTADAKPGKKPGEKKGGLRIFQRKKGE
jgi:large subunit ribosomal protein L17